MIYESELYHHGILGMSWGKKNGPPYPLGSGDHSASEKKAGWRKSLDDSKSSNNKSKSSNSKSSETDSEKAEKRKKTIKKALIITGAVAATAAIAYVAHNKYCKKYVDDIIKAGTKLQTITTDKNKDMGKRFYASYKETDKIVYKGLYGNQLVKGLFGTKNDVYNVTTETVKDLKIPSRDKAANVFSDLYKSDNNFKKEVNTIFDTYRKTPGLTSEQRKLFEATEPLTKLTFRNNDSSILLKEGYDAFNVALAGKGNYVSSSKFYDKLKSLGYNALTDMNDSKYSNFKASKPIIVFDTESVTKTVVDKVTDKQLKYNNIGQDLIRNGSDYAAKTGLYVGTVAGSIAISNKALKTRISSLKASGYTNEQIAKTLSISTSTVSKYLNN